MRINKYLLLATSAAFVAGIGFFSASSGFGHKPADNFGMVEENENEDANAIYGKDESTRST